MTDTTSSFDPSKVKTMADILDYKKKAAKEFKDLPVSSVTYEGLGDAANPE